MKLITTFLFLINVINSCFGQTLFFEDLNNSNWTSGLEVKNSLFSNVDEISLSKLIIPKDSIKNDIAIWTFRDSVLTISKYDYTFKKDSLIASFTFWNEDANLFLKPDNGLIQKFKVGIVSTGNYATLFKSKEHYASFVAKIDANQATKDGIYLNNYVINLPYDKIQELNGKTVQVSGKVTVVKGLKHYNDGIIRQGRNEDTFHILKPKIMLIE